MKTKGPQQEAFFPSSLVFFTKGHIFSLAAFSSGNSALVTLSLLSRKNYEPFASFQTATQCCCIANGIMAVLLELSCHRCPMRWTMSTSLRLSGILGATFWDFWNINDPTPDVFSLFLPYAMNLQGPPSAVMLTISNTCLQSLIFCL